MIYGYLILGAAAIVLSIAGQILKHYIHLYEKLNKKGYTVCALCGTAIICGDVDNGIGMQWAIYRTDGRPGYTRSSR